MSSNVSDRAARRRPTAAAALLLHLLVAALLPLAGSAHEAADAAQASHIEEEGGSPSCPRGHDHFQCVTCRLMATAFLLPAGTRCAELDGAIRQPHLRLVSALPPRLLQTSPPSSRAPPAT
jgi:hypothetical protein